MSDDKTSNWLIKPLVVTVIGGVIVTLILRSCSLSSDQNIKMPRELVVEESEQPAKKATVYYSWGYQELGSARKGSWLFGKRYPWYSVQFKVGIFGSSKKDIDVYIPVNGEVLDYDFPANVKYEVTDTGQDKVDRIESSFNVILKDVEPLQIVHFTFSLRHEFDDTPFDVDGISVFKGQGSALGWEDFSSNIIRKEKGFWKSLFD